MAGLGLASGIRAYQQGVEWKQRQEDDAVARSVRDEQIARQREMRAKLEEANKEFGRVIDESKAQWGLNGAQGQYTPNEETMFRAAEARGAALAKHGMWDEFMANEAKVAPMRQQARMRAVQRFEVDGDAESLARAIYPTLFDGKRLKSVTRDDGNGTGPAALMMEMDDGSKHAMPVDKLYQAAKMATDPEALKREALLNYERAKAGIYVDREGQVAKVRGTEAIRVDDAKTKNQAGLRAADNASREKIAAGRDQAMRDASMGRPRSGSTRADPNALPEPTPQTMGGGLTLLPDASPAERPPTSEEALGAARRESALANKTVEYDIGGQKGFIKRGGLSDAGPAKSTKATPKPATKPEKQAAEPKPGKGPDMAAAERVKADFKAGKLTREQATKKLRELGFK